MKKTPLIFLLLSIAILSKAQWNLNGTAVYYNGGNAGVGTDVPSNTQGWGKVLDVRGASDAKIIATTANAGYRVGIYAHTSWNGGGGMIGTETNHALHFITNYNAKMTIDVNGNVGIGILNPLSMLHVSGGEIALDADQCIRGGGRWLISGNSTQVTVGTSNPDIGLRFDAGSPNRMFINGTTGNVGIGTTAPDAKLTVKGDIHTKEVRVDVTGPLAGPDYVFEKDYSLLPLSELEIYINRNKHLPEVPSAKEMEANGLNLKEMNLILLKKVEELTLHLIEQNRNIEEMKRASKSQQDTINALEKEIRKNKTTNK